MRMLVVVDYEYDFVDGALGFEGAEKLDIGIAAKIREYKESGDVIIELKDTHRSDYLATREGKHLPVMHCGYQSQGWQTYGETGKLLDRLCETRAQKYKRICKESFGVHPIDMSELLIWTSAQLDPTAESIDEIEFVGLVSNICVISNICIFQGAFPNSQIVINPNLTASFDQDAHNAVLTVMKSLQVNFKEEEF